jgi:hypothetical protein
MINEEIDKIKYLFGYKPGVVISEQTTGATPSTGATTTPPPTTGTTPTSGTSETSKLKQKDIDKLRDCSQYNSTGSKSTNKLTKGEEVKDFIIFNGSDGKPACKKPKVKK